MATYAKYADLYRNRNKSQDTRVSAFFHESNHSFLAI